MDKETIEDYCRIIEKLDRGEGVSNKQLQEELGISKSTTSILLKKLEKEGFIKKLKYSKVFLTKKGKLVSRRMNFKHRVIETFFYRTLKLNKKRVHIIAHKIEHGIDYRTAKKMYDFLGKPKYDCHGSPIK